MAESSSQGRRLFLALLIPQGLALIAALGVVALIGAATEAMVAALLGGSISILANAWAGFQLWLHPANRSPARQASASMRAEAGKVAIVLLLFGTTFSKWPAASSGSTGIILVLVFLWTYLAGLLALHRASRDAGKEYSQS